MDHTMRQLVMATLVFAVLLCGAGRLPAASTTQPDNHPSLADLRPGPAYVIRRLKDAVAKLDLNDDEKTKVAAVFDQAIQQGLALSQTLGDLPIQQRYPMLVDFDKQIRAQLAAVLNDDQMAELDHDMTLRPPQPNGGNRPNAGGSFLDNIQQAINKLDLTDDQKQQISELFETTRQKLADLQQKAANGDNVQADRQQLLQTVREKIQTILSPDQLQSLQQSLQQYRQQRPNEGGGGSGQGNNGNSPKPIADKKPEDLTMGGPDIGSPVPAIKIQETNGRVFDPASYKGRVLVLEFGSLSCPTFRQQVQAMETLKNSEGGRAFFLIVYTREAFPAGTKDVERNRSDGISVSETTTLDERKARALQAQNDLHITIPMAVDPMDNSVSAAFGTFPNGAVVIGKDATIAELEHWTNPDTLKVAIDDAVSQGSNP
jgi:Spy/CpxP family protein refolding chaperone